MFVPTVQAILVLPVAVTSLVLAALDWPVCTSRCREAPRSTAASVRLRQSSSGEPGLLETVSFRAVATSNTRGVGGGHNTGAYGGGAAVVAAGVGSTVGRGLMNAFEVGHADYDETASFAKSLREGNLDRPGLVGTDGVGQSIDGRSALWDRWDRSGCPQPQSET